MMRKIEGASRSNGWAKDIAFLRTVTALWEGFWPRHIDALKIMYMIDVRPMNRSNNAQFGIASGIFLLMTAVFLPLAGDPRPGTIVLAWILWPFFMASGLRHAWVLARARRDMEFRDALFVELYGQFLDRRGLLVDRMKEVVREHNGSP